MAMTEQEQKELSDDYTTLRRAFYMAIAHVITLKKPTEENLTAEDLNKQALRFIARAESIDLARFFIKHNRLPTEAEIFNSPELTAANNAANKQAEEQIKELADAIAAARAAQAVQEAQSTPAG